MASLPTGGVAEQSPVKLEVTARTTKVFDKLPRRQWTLIGITTVLNVLFFSSFLCIVAQIYEIVDDPGDTTNIASEVLTLTSALATLIYINLHCIFSLKQRIWRHQRQHSSADKKTSYVAVRFVGSLCVLWMLTGGWNMILVARRPVCLPEMGGVHSWEVGKTCQVGRFGIAFAMIAMIASYTLFGILTAVNRPFEAHLWNCKFAPSAPSTTVTPSASRGTSPSRSASDVSDQRHRRGVSFSTHRSTLSNVSNADVTAFESKSSVVQVGIVSPAPIRSLGSTIFTSRAQPPPLPAAYVAPSRSSSVEPPPLFQPSLSSSQLPLPPRLSTARHTAGFVPVPIPAQYATSSWRAVHPPAPSPLGPSTSRSYSNLALAASAQSLPYRARYSRSSISLTRPHRLSSATPTGSVDWTSRSGSASPEKRQQSPNSDEEGPARASAGEIAYAILNGTSIPGTGSAGARPLRHARHVSAPDTMAGASAPQLSGKTWKASPTEPIRAQAMKAIRVSVTRVDVNPAYELKTGSEGRPSLEQPRKVRRVRSEDIIRRPVPAKTVGRTATTSTRVLHSESTGKRAHGASWGRRSYEEAKNKPLPRIAAL